MSYARGVSLRQSEGTDSSSMLEEGSGFNQTTTTMPAMSSPILSPSAIANIICSVLAVVFITTILCYLMRSFSENERKTRIKTSLENNRRIDEQIAAAKARAEQQRTTEKTSLIQGPGRETCTASLEVVAVTQDFESQPLVVETLDGPPNSNSSQVSAGSGVNREVVHAALTSSRTLH